MRVKAIDKYKIKSQPKSLLRSVKDKLIPLGKEAVRFVKEKPLIVSGVTLIFAAFISGIVSKKTFNLMPIFGIPAIGLFIYQIILGKDKPTNV